MATKTKLPPRVVTLDHVPATLGSNFYSFERLYLLSTEGKFLFKYNNTGSVLLAGTTEKDSKIVKNTSPIITLELNNERVISAHEDESIQTIHLQSNSVETRSLSNDVKKKVQCILFGNERVYIISSTSVIIFEIDNNSISQNFKELLFKNTQDDKTRPIIGVVSNFSKVLTNSKLLLANSDVFQVWRINESKEEMSLCFEGRNPNNVKYFGVYSAFGLNTVITNNRNHFSVWTIDQPLEAANPVEEVEECGVITTLFMDDVFLICGCSDGSLSLRNRFNGKLLYYLNQQNPNPPPPNSPSALIEWNFSNKINTLMKSGRWVFVGSETSHIRIYDITKERALPVLEYFHKSGPVRSLIVGDETVLAAIKSKSGNTEHKQSKKIPDIISWQPKLPGMAFYRQRMNSFFASSISIADYSAKDLQSNKMNTLSLLLAYSYNQVTEYFDSIRKAGEDVIEFTTITERVQELIRVLNKYGNDLVKILLQNGAFQSFADLQTTLDQYVELLEQLTSAGKLIRFFTSSRLRKNLEQNNNSLHKWVSVVEDKVRQALKERSSTIPQWVNGDTKAASSTSSSNGRLLSRVPSMVIPSAINHGRSNTDYPLREIIIVDEGGKEFWKQAFAEAVMVEWDLFILEFQRRYPGNFTPKDENDLQSILDHSDTGYVSQYKISEFLKGFGPFEKCIDNVRSILGEEWFHGFLSSRESELLLKTGFEAEGTFLVRFSKSKPGSFALAFVKSNAVKHILIESAMPEGFRISEQESTSTVRTFKTLYDVISYYSFVLKVPFRSNLPKRAWFSGDISTEEANELLAMQRNGTFIIRFSSKGCFAASFVDNTSVVRHVLITSKKKNDFEVISGQNGDVMCFNSIENLVNHYIEKSIFKYPLKTTNK